MSTETRGSMPTPRYAGYALAVLTAVNLLNYLERNAIFALFEPLKRNLHLSDSQLGWLGSAYVLVFSLASLPLGILGDLRSRRGVIAGGIVLWSLATSLSGLAWGFGSLFLARALVGLGGAAAAAAAASLVADFYPGRRRAFAMGIFMSGLAVGGVAGILIAGQLEALYGWRVTLLALGLPGFGLAAVVVKLVDPTRSLIGVPLRTELKALELGVASLTRAAAPLLMSIGLGALVAYLLDQRLHADSRLDTALFTAIVGIGLIWNIRRLVAQHRSAPGPAPTPGEEDVVARAMADVRNAFRVVLGTPTLVYVFVGGALISFGMNGLVAWAPTFISRTLALSTSEASRLLGVAGLLAGTAGTLAGGGIADFLRRRFPSARALTVGAGFLIGTPLLVWLLSSRERQVFVPLFYAAFFFLTWYNGPLTAIIFDVVPSRIGTTVVGAYLMFIHIAGDTVAFPLIGALSDRFGLHRAIYLLPAAAVTGALIVLVAGRSLARDLRNGPSAEEPAEIA